MENNNVKIYTPEELKVMNYILGKAENNCLFTTTEIEYIFLVDLKNETLVYIAQDIWKHRNDEKYMDDLLSLIDEKGGII